MAYVVCAKWTAKEGKEDRLVEIIEEMTPPSRGEPGNLY
jgi:quinol monooxygenase YgiN